MTESPGGHLGSFLGNGALVLVHGSESAAQAQEYINDESVWGPLQLQIAKIVPVSVILRKEEDETDQSMHE